MRSHPFPAASAFLRTETASRPKNVRCRRPRVELQVPKTWHDLQALNSLIPSHFQPQRYEALRGENGAAFGSIDSTLASAVWSRKDTDNPDELLPANLVQAARELLDLMRIRKPENAMQRGLDAGRHVLSNIKSLVSFLGKRLRGTAAMELE